MTGQRRISVQPSREAVGASAAGIVEALLRGATPTQPALLLLSGGSSVLGVCAELARRPLPWSAVRVGQLDERAAPPSHPERAWPAIERSFLARITVAGAHPIPVDDRDAAQAASEYRETLDGLVRSASTTVALCGLGEDGHVASLLPGDEHRGSAAAALTTGPYDGVFRITASMALLHRLTAVVVVASGTSKAAALRRLDAATPEVPAAWLPAHTEFVVDGSAAALLDRSPHQEQFSGNR